MQKKIYLFSFATALWLGLSAFYSGPAESSARTGPTTFHPAPPPEEPCGSEGVTFSTDNGDFPYGQMTQWTVPAGVTEVTIIAKGSSGYMSLGGEGATAQSTFTVSPGDVLNVIVGTTGSGYGGGGSGVYNNTSSTLLIVAGGGGAESFGGPGEGGRDTEAGGNNGGLAAPGGINGNGGSGDGGGGGAFSAGSGSGGGAAGVPNGGGTFTTSFGLGAGGVAPPFTGSGGGGGYSGGGASPDEFVAGGGGGGSYAHPSGTNTTITAGANGASNGPGTVSICYTPAPQCPPGDVELYSQAEVDAFVAAYPNCTEIAGDLVLGDENPDPINDISGLSAITSITGYLGIGYTDLASLDGLDNLAAVGTSLEPGFPVSIVLVNNASLADIGAFSNLTSLPGAIVLFQSSSLTNLNGFSNLNSVGGFYLFLETSLTSLAGLENITSYGGIGLAIFGSSALSSLTGLNDGATFANIDIESNPLLSACESPAICNHLAGGGPAVIQDNAPGCSSVAEVEAACNPCDLLIDNDSSPESCPGASDGTITSFPFCTTCSGIEYSIDGVNFQASATFTGLASGPYTVTARDAGDYSCFYEQFAFVESNDTDSDHDGIPDCLDNCPSGSNHGQQDADGDGIGDACDTCPYDPDNDADGDGICGDVDNCPDTANAGQEDDDCDGVGNACDLCDGGDDSIDNNNDGLPDCAYPPAYADIIAAWKCGNGNNQKVLVCHKGKNTNCISINALFAHIGHGDYLGPCGGADCGGSARVAPGGVAATQSEEALQLQAFPNPFTQQVSLQYYLPAEGRVQLSIFSIHGQVVAKVVNEQQAAGLQRVEWRNDTGLPAGVYFARLQTESGVSTLQLVLAR